MVICSVIFDVTIVIDGDATNWAQVINVRVLTAPLTSYPPFLSSWGPQKTLKKKNIKKKQNKNLTMEKKEKKKKKKKEFPLWLA